MCLRKLGRYLCILGTVKWMNDVLWLDIRGLQVAEIEEWLKETWSRTALGRKMVMQSRTGSGQYLVRDFWNWKYCRGCCLWSILLRASAGLLSCRGCGDGSVLLATWNPGPKKFKNSGLHFTSPEAVNQDPGWVSTTVITMCQCRFCLPLKSHPLFFTSFAKLLYPPCCRWWW